MRKKDYLSNFIRKPFPFLFFFLLDSGPYSTASPEFYIFKFFGIISSFLAFGGQFLWFTSIRSRRRCNLIVLISRCVDPASCQVFKNFAIFRGGSLYYNSDGVRKQCSTLLNLNVWTLNQQRGYDVQNVLNFRDVYIHKKRTYEGEDDVG